VWKAAFRPVLVYRNSSCDKPLAVDIEAVIGYCVGSYLSSLVPELVEKLVVISLAFIVLDHGVEVLLGLDSGDFLIS